MIGGAKGIGIGIDFGIPNQYCRATSKPYIEKDVLDSLRVVASAYGKSNDDADRSIVKNLVDASNPFIISNAAFKLNSGFGKYETELSDTRIWTKSKDVTSSPFSSSYNGLSGWIIFANTELTNSVDIPSIKIEVKGLLEGQELIYRYYDSTGQTNVYSMTKDGEYTLPADVRTAKTLTSNTSGFQIVKNETNTNTITITQIPSFEGAFVTDGIDDLITSTKTVQEMLGGSNEITVVSMIHQIDGNVNYTNGYTNYIRHGGGFIRNSVTGINGKGFNKTGIYGYTSTQLDSSNMGLGNVINNILGDKDDYSFERSSTYTLDDAKYSVQNFVNANNQPSNEGSSVAWYWTIIANKVLTTGNGRDIQLNNLAWDGDSGIGKYNYPNWKVTATIANTYSTIVNYPTVNGTYSINVNGVSELMQSIGLHLEIKYTTSTGIIYKDIKQDGVYSYILPDGATDLTLRFGGIPGIVNEPCNITITQIPSHAGALCLDGVNDFGKVTGMPIYKDYTVVADYIRTSAKENAQDSPILSKSQVVNNGAFVFNYLNINSVLNSYSFGINNGLESISDSERKIYYQSKYVNDGKSINSGTGIDYNSMWLGTYRDNVQIFFNGAIYSLMSFPYSMSKFLIERQLKKYKLGTLYPNMVEFRPVIKKDDRIKSIKYYIDGKTANIGQYYPIGTGLGIAVETVQPYMVKSLKVNGVNTIPNADYKGFNARLDSKSPQKITMDIQVDTNLIQWNPIITSTVELTTAPTFAIRGTSTLLKPGDWIPKNSEIWVIVTMNNLIDELRKFSFNGTFINIPSSSYNPDTGKYGFPFVIDNESTQNINLTIDEYIRFEDIVQPYPVLLRFNDENGNEVSWGGKFRVGSTITRIGSFYENNLIDGLYIVHNPKLNGNNLITPTHVVEKSMVFTCDTEYLLDNNEPKCILSPSRLRMPNSSYKILGYIPDISGHGNHGVIHNSAYAGMSGANGYLQNFSGWTKASGVSSTDSVISSSNNLVAANGWIAYVTSGNVIPTFKVEISGIPVNGNLRFEGSDQVLVNGVNTIQGLTTTKVSGFYISSGYDNDWSNLKIEQIGKYEGAYYFDGVDDFVTIPTVTGGGKQVLMKVNNNTINSILYDQRSSSASPNSLNSDFAICNTNTVDNNLIAYQSRLVGKTYIDGILNTNITCEDLLGVLHNITITCDIVVPNNGVVPNIGRGGVLKDLYSKVALYDFMLFDNISTDDKIKELNEYIGIEAKVELPPYYWDAYGKTNLDVDRGIVPQLGIAKDYSFASFDNEMAWYLIPNDNYINVVSRNGYEITLKNLSTGVNGWRFQNSTVKGFISHDIPFRIKANKSIRVYWDMHSYKVSTGAEFGEVISITNVSPNKDTYINLRHLTEEELAKLDTNKDRMYYLLWFDLSTIAVNEEVVIEMLPVEGGRNLWLNNYNFAYDKMSGFGGYAFAKFDNTSEWNLIRNSTGIEVVSRNGYSCTLKRVGSNVWDFGNSSNRKIGKDLNVNIKCDKNIKIKWQLKYKTTENPDTEITVELVNDSIGPNPKSITLPHKTDEELTTLGAIESSVYYLVYFDSSTLPIGEEYTVEMLPLYPNGLVYDGVTDYSENANIPALTDYTYIFKREFLSKTTGSASMYKGEFFANGGMAFIADYAISDGSLYGFSYRGQAKVNSLNTDKIIYGTKTSVNGSSITPNTNIDTAGLTMGKFDSYRKMVFYKLILYPKTIPLLQINFLKNLMEKDEIIDLDNKIFIQE